MDDIIELTVEDHEAGVRIDAYLRAHTELSRSRIAALMQEGALTVDGQTQTKPAAKTESGQVLRLTVPQARPVDIAAQDIPLDILYQDSDVVVVNKP